MNMVRAEFNYLLLALTYFTRLPLTRWVEFSEGALGRSARYFPVAGLVVGTIGAGVYLAAVALDLGPLLAVLASLAATVICTGGFHEDGLADTCDALGVLGDRDRALEVMKDSRLGTFGALGLGLALATKTGALVQLSTADVAGALVAGHALSRAGAMALIRVLPYVATAATARARPVARRTNTPGVLVALAIGTIPLYFLAPVFAVAAATILPTTLLAAWLFRQRFGGITGDTLGASQLANEVVFYLALVALT